MIRFVVMISLLLTGGHNLFSQTFQGTIGAIRDDGIQTDFGAEVTGLIPGELTPEYGLKTVCINLTHTWIADLDVHLISPDGTNITLTSGLGGDTDFYEHTCFNMQAIDNIFFAGPPYNGTYKPFSNMGNINNGNEGNGQWILRILDTYAFADAGEVLDWSITFDADAAVPTNFASSKLPIILLNTENNLSVPNEPKIAGTIRVIDNGVGQLNALNDVPNYEGIIGIEVRGASSQGFPKKSFGFETRDSFGEDKEVSLLGMPKDEDWILYAPFTDKTFLRDALTYELGNKMGKYAPRTQFCEVFLNGDYQGIYGLEEKIKRDKNRVDIARLTEADTLGEELTGGYILKVDRDDGEGSYFLSEYEGTDTLGEIRIVYEDPDGIDLHPLQKEYITGYFQDFENVLYSDEFADTATGYRRYIDVPSFIDFFLINEIGHNVDGYRLSTFLYKDRNSKDSLFHAGPLWDFNLAYGNVNYCDCQLIEGWAYEHSGACSNTPLWWKRLLEDPRYRDELQCRYKELRETVLSTGNIFHDLDSMSSTIGEAIDRNYDKWPILGLYIWPNNFIGSTYEEELNYMKLWIADRLNWIDDNLPGYCFPVSVHDELAGELTVYPNPASDFVSIRLENGNTISGTLTLSDMSGKTWLVESLKSDDAYFNVADLPPGIYVATLLSRESEIFKAKIVVSH